MCAGNAAQPTSAPPSTSSRTTVMDSMLSLSWVADDSFLYCNLTLNALAWCVFHNSQRLRHVTYVCRVGVAFGSTTMFPSRPVVGIPGVGVSRMAATAYLMPSTIAPADMEAAAAISQHGGCTTLSFKRRWDTGTAADGVSGL